MGQDQVTEFESTYRPKDSGFAQTRATVGAHSPCQGLTKPRTAEMSGASWGL